MERTRVVKKKIINNIMLHELREKIRRAKQDADIGKDTKGTQPAKYYAKDAEGDEMSDKTKAARAKHFKNKTKMDDDNPKAYTPAPGDKDAETKPSQHTKKFKKMYGEDTLPEVEDLEIWKELEEGKLVAPFAGILDSLVSKVKSKVGKVYSKDEKDGIGLMNSIASLVGAKVMPSHKRKGHLYIKDDFEPLDEVIKNDLKDADKKYLQKRVSEMQKLIDKLIKMRGVQPEDKDAWKKVQQAKFAIEDMLEEEVKLMDACWQGYKQVGMKKKGDKMVPDCVPESKKIDIKKVLKKIKGVSYKQAEVIAAMNPAIITQIAQQMSGLVMGEDLDKNADAGDYIDDFRKSDAPQFKGKSDAKIRKMAIAAFLKKKNDKA